MKLNNGIATFITVIIALAAVIVMPSCSVKKNNAATRKYQEFITRYNIYYNGDTHYNETLDKMERYYEDDFTRLLFLHPAEAKADEKAPQPNGDFTRSIEKAQKAIQLRSIKKRPPKKAGKSNDPEYKEWMKREEYNPFLHNAWMMMGRSQFMNGDFLGAAATFFYISKHFTWLPATVTEAKLWQARSYCALDWLFEAESIITKITPEMLTSKQLKLMYATTSADLYIKNNDYERAIESLKEAVSLSSGVQKTRLTYLLGQIYARTGNRAEAYTMFKKVAGSSSASYRTKFNARIMQSEVYDGTNIKPEVDALKRMTRYDRNKEYLDQIYYAIGNLYMSRRDTTQAIDNYETAIEKSTRNGIEKAIAQITLGKIYFERQQYEKAQPCYAEAIPLLPESYPGFDTLRRRSDVLDELAVYSQNVTLQDSLLKLSMLTPEEQMKVVEGIIERLKKKEKEEAENAAREEYLAMQAAAGTGLTNNNAATPNSFQLNNDNSWYFYNTATRNAGKTEFQKRWGSRKLEDDWRRRNKASFSFNDFETEGENGEGEDGPDNEETTESNNGDGDDNQSNNANDPHYPEYYLRQIPKTDEERTVANEIIQEGLFNMGVILKDKLEDFNAAEAEFNQLMQRYPDNVYRLDVYYNLYLMYMRQDRPDLAERYRQLIIDEFPESNYGIAMRDPEYIEKLRNMEEIQEKMYADAYTAYLNNDNQEVHEAYSTMSQEYPMSKIMPKFMFIDALTYVTENNPKQFKERLKEMLEKYPETDVTPLATAYLQGLASGRKLHSGGSNPRGMLWDIRLSNDSTLTEQLEPAEFTLNPDTTQLFILLFPTDTVAPNELLFKIARHNFNSFVVKDFDLEMMNFGRLGLLIIKGFDNRAEINNYRRVMAESSSLDLPRQVRPVIISAGDFDKLLKEGRSFEEYFRYAREQMYIKTEEEVLPPSVYGPSEGIPDENQEPEDAIINVEEQIITTGQPTEPVNGDKDTAKEKDKDKNKDKQQDNNKKKRTTTLPDYLPGSEGDEDPLLTPPPAKTTEKK